MATDGVRGATRRPHRGERDPDVRIIRPRTGFGEPVAHCVHQPRVGAQHAGLPQFEARMARLGGREQRRQVDARMVGVAE